MMGLKNAKQTLFGLGALCLAGCSDGRSALAPSSSVARVGASMPAPSAADAAEPASAPSCPPVADGCIGPSTRLDCALGEMTEVRCADQEVCLSGACVKGDARERSFSDEGFFNAWSGYFGVSKKTSEALRGGASALSVLEKEQAKPLCSADGWIDVRSGTTGQTLVLFGVLRSSEARTLRFYAGTEGAATLRVGSRVAEFSELPGRGDARPMADEQSALLPVEAGDNEVVLLVSPPKAGFFLRARSERGEKLSGLTFREGVPEASCSPGDLVDVAWTSEWQSDRYVEALSASWHGLVPRGEHPLVVRVLDGTKPTFEAKFSSKEGRSVALSRQTIEGAAWVDKKQRLEVSAERPLFVSARPTRKRVEALSALRLALSEQRSAAAPAASVDTLELEIGRLETSIFGDDRDEAWISKGLAETATLAEGLRAGKDPLPDRRGTFVRGARTAADGRLHPLWVHVPKSVDQAIKKGERVPLVLIAHGRDRLPEHALRTLIGEAPDEHMTLRFAARHLPRFPDQGAILAAPWTLGNGGTQTAGEAELMNAVASLEAAYPIDPRRISITGYSLGGTIAFMAPLHFPDRFSTSVPLCGYPNLMDYSSVAKVPHLPWEDVLLEKEYLARYADNAMYHQMNIIHGGKDGPGRSKVIADRLKANRYPHRFDIQDDLEHNVWDYAYEDSKMIPWMKGRRVPERPDHVRFVTGKLRYNRAYWVQIEALEEASSKTPARVDATLDRDQSSIRIEAENLHALTLDLPSLALANATVSIELNGQKLSAPTNARLTLVRRADGAYDANASWSPEGRKHHGSSGPIDDVGFDRTVIVIGTATPSDEEAHRLVAEHLRSLGRTADFSLPILSDREATEERLAGQNVILLGGQASNGVTRALGTYLPVTIDSEGVTLGKDRHGGSDVGIAMVYPRPVTFFTDAHGRADRGYVLLYAGVSPHAVRAARHLPRYLPDFVIWDDGMTRAVGGLLMGDRKVVRAGFFSETWEVP